MRNGPITLAACLLALAGCGERMDDTPAVADAAPIGAPDLARNTSAVADLARMEIARDASPDPLDAPNAIVCRTAVARMTRVDLARIVAVSVDGNTARVNAPGGDRECLIENDTLVWRDMRGGRPGRWRDERRITWRRGRTGYEISGV